MARIFDTIQLPVEKNGSVSNVQFVNNPKSTAPQFSTGTAYTKGQYVYYSNALYRFTADHAAGAWNAAHATAVTVGSELKGAAAEVADLKEDLNEAIYDPITIAWTDDKFINKAGTVYDSTLFALSGNVSVSGKTSVEVVTDIQGTAVICIFDVNGSAIGYVEGTSGVKPYVISLPIGADYIRISCYKSNKNQASVKPIYVSDTLNSFIKTNDAVVVRSPKNTEIIDGVLLTTNGATPSSSDWEVSDFIPVYPNTGILKLHCFLFGTGSVVLYDGEKNVLLGISGNTASQYGGTSTNAALQDIMLTDQQNVRFVRFCSQKSRFRVTAANAIYDSPWKEHIEEVLGNSGETYADKKVLVIGDSISSDAYGNYKKWVTNLIDEGKFKLSNVTNSSQHATGFVARYSSQNPDDFITRMEAIADKSTYDLVVVFGGINDYIQNVPLGGESGETDKTVYFKPAVDYFFNYLVNNFTQARICVLLPLRTYNIWPNTAGNKQTVYADYIHEVAKSYCLPVLNLTEESGFCPFIDSFKQMWTLIPSGYTAPDGTHPNAEYEKKYLAPMIWKFISGLINDA